MRISLESDGGFAVFPGLNRTVTVDTGDLPDPAAADLEGLARAVADEPHPATIQSAGGDRRTYRITVTDEGGSHTLEYLEPVADEAARALIDRLRGYAG
ncbi:protealysin inhibitor emfourin [Amycolatopsis sp. CA-230715]|uniref:protealysin inhibitor emfourin n=1 Tax=Amycolatopsis sp. CA-230715 TaxID=2745196 RepID=UPI001C0307E5|nr:protealysin inhibitor emfourin [Amycolatopsis sp. CA-230715]QWF85182.1 hypothetical protein HUW46_08636 [Amycolatopsis sp. CA-230715]